MPHYGTLDIATIEDRPPVAPPDSARAWEIAGTTVVSLSFELATHQMLDLLPAGLVRPVPAYAKLVILDAPAAPGGPYREAALSLGTREGLAIRNYLVDAVVQGKEQLAASRARFGGSRRLGSVALDAGATEISAEISDEQGKLATIHLHDVRPCDATMLKFDALQVAGTVDGQPELLRYGLRVELTEVEGFISKRWEVRMERRAGAWWKLRPAYNITAFVTRGPVRLEYAQSARKTSATGANA